MSARDSILGRIRAAQGKAGAVSPQERAAVASCIGAHALSPRPSLDWVPAVRFRDQVLALSSTYEEVGAIEDAPRAVAVYLRGNALPLAAVCWPELSGLLWQEAGLAVEARASHGNDLVGITGAYCAIAETGTLLLLSSPRTPAAASLLPETHIALVRANRIVRTMEDAWALVRSEHGMLPRAVNFVSGPSRTADIEQTLTLGAHGPYRVHIVLVR
jgi:L-lactate dehydrogenase complex protein LldG